MSRIQKAYETRFRWLLGGVRARRLDQGVQWLVQKARRMSADMAMPLSDALTRIYGELATRRGFVQHQQLPEPVHFFCDAGLGGLARWLRAAGYEAEWEAGIDDDELLRRAREIAAVILTTDSMLMERRLLRDRVIPSLWLPPTLKIPEQLALVFREFKLRVRRHRCMACGGELCTVDKEQMRERIPPKTYRWRDDYFLCGRCGKLFWHGTHWERMKRALNELGGGRHDA